MKTLNRMKESDISLANVWTAIHNKPYITSTDDLNKQIERYNRSQLLRHLTSIVVATIVAGFFGYWLTRSPEQINVDSLSGLSALVGLIWFCVYGLCRPQHPDKVAVFKSVVKFHRDWKEMKKLEQKGNDLDHHLYRIGGEIAEAERMLNKQRAESLKKRLKKDQKTLLAFGRCEEDWGVYIPKPSPKKETVIIRLRVAHD